MGVPEARITTVVDATPVIDAKRSAMAAHASQISESSVFLGLPAEVFALTWGPEWFIRRTPLTASRDPLGALGRELREPMPAA